MTERIDPDAFYWAEDVARIVFGRSARWFSRQRDKLHAEGFPKPISEIGRPRWSGATLTAWRSGANAGYPPAPLAAAGSADVPDNVVPWDQLLRERAKRLYPSRRHRSESR